MKILLIIITLFLTACKSTPGLSFYSLSNADVESALSQEIPKLSQKIKLAGVPIQLDVNDLNVNIGPDNRDVVALEVDSSAEIKVFTFRYPVNVKLQIEGSPFYDSEEKAIFLRNLTLLDSSIDAGGFSGDLGLLNNEVMDVINVYLETNPVYKLNMNDPKISLLSKLPLDIKVVQGAITLVPRIQF